MSAMRPPSSEALPMTIYHQGQISESTYWPTEQNKFYMDLAIEQASLAKEAQDNPIGSVLVVNQDEEERVYQAGTREFRDQNLQAHAEMLVYGEAREDAGIGRDLSRSELYTTAEPCFMCAYVLDKGAIGMLFIAADKTDSPDFFRSRDTLAQVWTQSRRTLAVVRGLRKIEAAELLTAGTKKH